MRVVNNMAMVKFALEHSKAVDNQHNVKGTLLSTSLGERPQVRAMEVVGEVCLERGNPRGTLVGVLAVVVT